MFNVVMKLGDTWQEPKDNQGHYFESIVSAIGDAKNVSADHPGSFIGIVILTGVPLVPIMVVYEGRLFIASDQMMWFRRVSEYLEE